MKNYRLVFRAVDRDKFDEIAEGRKTIETRAATSKYQPIQAGDTLTFVCGKDSIVKQVIKVEHYGSLEQMFSHLPLSSILPAAANQVEAKKIYYGFPGYKEKLETVGILAFTLGNRKT